MDEFEIECVKKYRDYFSITVMNLGIELKLLTFETDSHIKGIQKVTHGDISDKEKMGIEKLLLKERIRIMQGKYRVCESD